MSGVKPVLVWIPLLIVGCHIGPRPSNVVQDQPIPGSPTITPARQRHAIPEQATPQPVVGEEKSKKALTKGPVIINLRPPSTTLPRVIVSGHAPDYSWIQGALGRFGKSWHLRYAPPGEEDQYGGSLKLQYDPLLKKVKEGDQVRIYGSVEKERRSISSPSAHTYYIRRIEKVQ